MDHYGQHSMNSVASSMNLLSVNGVGTQNPSISSSNPQYYPSMSVVTSTTPSNDDFFQDFVKNNNTSTTPNVTHSNVTPTTVSSSNLNIVPHQQVQPSYDPEVINHLRTGMTRMMAILERLEQRIARVEQSTSQILKNQQESFQVPFMSQKEIDNARQLAEQLEQDSNVAKQLQAAYNKEIELKKRSGHPMMLAECPVCGVKVSQVELEAHVEKCLDMFSDDPKKQAEVKDTKQKMETGFFGKFFNKTKTETTQTTTTKVISRSNSTNMPETEMPQQSLYPTYGYPQFMPPQNMHNINGVPMMMPMYMYPGYPGNNQQNE